MTRIAILDDYQGVARGMADWASLPEGTEVVVFADHLSDTEAVAARLADFDAVVAMRERTPFFRALLEKLPSLKLLVTTGMGNASIDMAAARERGTRVRHVGASRSDGGADVGTYPRPRPPHPERRSRHA